jgi:hypothetical protein
MSMTSDAGISVTMDGGQVVLRPCGHLDREAIEALLGLVAGAKAAGAVAIVDLEQVDPADRAAALAALGRTCLVAV